jgi:hypothetical protein
MKYTKNIQTKEDRYGHRYFVFNNETKILAEIAGLAVGKDAWVSQIQLECKECKEMYAVKQMHCGGQFCEECYFYEPEQE